MRLIHWNEREREGISLSQIESPFFAVSTVRNAFQNSASSLMYGLQFHSNGKVWSQKEILSALENCDLFLVTNDPFSPLSNDTLGRYSFFTGKGRTGSIQRPQASEPSPVPTRRPKVRPHPQEPGFYIVPKSTTVDELKTTLFPAPSAEVLEKFQSLNPNLGEVKAGSMIVLADPNSPRCTREDSILMEAAAQTNDALEPLSTDEADFMQRHREEIQGFLALGSTSIGAGEAMFARNMGSLKSVLQEIETLHQTTFLKDGHLRSPEFFSERKRLLAQLDTQLTSLVRKGIGLPDHPNLKSALGISSRSLVHRWTQAGAPGQIPGYATHIQKLAKAATVIKYGGWVGTSIGGGASYMKVQNVCSAGDDEACQKVKFTETGSFTGTIGGGAVAGAALSTAVVGGLCVGLGVPTMGAATLACGLIVVGAGSVAGGALGGAFGEWVGEKIYEAVK